MPSHTPNAGRHARVRRRDVQAGFTLIELMVVVAIIAIATAAVGLSAFSRPDSSLRRDGERLAQLFEVAQSEARAGGRAIRWETNPEGYRFVRRAAPPAAAAHAAVRQHAEDRFERDEVLRPRRWEAGSVTVTVSRIAVDAIGQADIEGRSGHLDAAAATGTVFTREWVNPPLRIDLRSADQHVQLIRDAAGRYEVRP